MRELHEETGLDESTLHFGVSRLEEQGLVSRGRDPEDLRHTRVEQSD